MAILLKAQDFTTSLFFSPKQKSEKKKFQKPHLQCSSKFPLEVNLIYLSQQAFVFCEVFCYCFCFLLFIFGFHLFFFYIIRFSSPYNTPYYSFPALYSFQFLTTSPPLWIHSHSTHYLKKKWVSKR